MTNCSLLALDYCVVEGTKIITTEGILPIEKVHVGMGVLSCENGTDLTISKVLASQFIDIAPVVEITTDDGSTTTCTRDHTWMRFNGEMVKADGLQVGDRLAHVKSGFSGRYPTWYIRSYHNYTKKHKAVCKFTWGERPSGYDVDHIDGDIMNWGKDNLHYMDGRVNRSQGGRRYWRAVKNGERCDQKRLEALRVGLSKRRSYAGEGNPNYGKRSGVMRECLICGTSFYTYPSQVKKFCSRRCYIESRCINHKVAHVWEVGMGCVYQITVENTHNYVLENGMVSGNSQIELRVSAHESQDPTMLNIYWGDGDIHMTTACRMFGLPPEKIDDKAHRRPAKTTNFGSLYLIGAKGLFAQFQHEGLTHFSERDCQDFLDSFRRTYPGFYDWVEEIKAEARRTGMVRDMFGRIRWIPELNSSLKYVREAGLRQAVNAPIQSGAGGILKEAMRRLQPIVHSWQTDYGVVCRPLLQVHDELIFEVEDEYLPVIAPQFHKEMVEAVELSVPVKVDCETGKNWKELEEYNL